MFRTKRTAESCLSPGILFSITVILLLPIQDSLYSTITGAHNKQTQKNRPKTSDFGAVRYQEPPRKIENVSLLQNTRLYYSMGFPSTARLYKRILQEYSRKPLPPPHFGPLHYWRDHRDINRMYHKGFVIPGTLVPLGVRPGVRVRRYSSPALPTVRRAATVPYVRKY